MTDTTALQEKLKELQQLATESFVRACRLCALQFPPIDSDKDYTVALTSLNRQELKSIQELVDQVAWELGRAIGQLTSNADTREHAATSPTTVPTKGGIFDDTHE